MWRIPALEHALNCGLDATFVDPRARRELVRVGEREPVDAEPGQILQGRCR